MRLSLSLFTLGVADIAAARAFYEALGWTASSASQPEVVFFQVGAMVVGLYDRQHLAQDAQLPDHAGRFGGITLACNLPSKSAVDRMMQQALDAGATLLKKPQDVFWGGYSGYFADLDHHPWELAWNPFFPLSETGQITLP